MRFFASLPVGLIATIGLAQVAVASTAAWNVDADGSYLTPANWTNNHVPSGTTDTAQFGGIITQPRTVTLDGSVVLDTVSFDSAIPYTITGSPNVLTLGGADHELNAAQGAHNIQVRVSSSTAITKTGAGSVSLAKLTAADNVAVNGGTLSLSGGTTVASKFASVTVADGAQLTVGQTPVVFTSTTENSLRLLLRDGKVAIGSPSNRALGYAVGALIGSGGSGKYTTVGGEDIAPTDIVLRLTRLGDGDLDLVVGFTDILLLAKNYGRTDTTWRLGDYNYDGVTNFDDLLALAQNYGGTALSADQLAGFDRQFASDWSLAMSLVPEPASLASILVAGVILRRTRK